MTVMDWAQVAFLVVVVIVGVGGFWYEIMKKEED